jgi:hypothetical protein
VVNADEKVTEAIRGYTRDRDAIRETSYLPAETKRREMSRIEAKISGLLEAQRIYRDSGEFTDPLQRAHEVGSRRNG